MTILHTINKSPFQTTDLDSCLRHARKGSAILLIEDAVYAAMGNTGISERVGEALKNTNVYVLGPDLDARGLERERVVRGVEIVDYGGFVDLAVEHDHVQAWV